jgi:hypothetical protein
LFEKKAIVRSMLFARRQTFISRLEEVPGRGLFRKEHAMKSIEDAAHAVILKAWRLSRALRRAAMRARTESHEPRPNHAVVTAPEKIAATPREGSDMAATTGLGWGRESVRQVGNGN